MGLESGKFDEELLKEFDWLYEWTDHPQNPLVEATEEGDWVADPTIVLPSQSPDGFWHMLCSGRGIKHWTSKDGICWIYKGLVCPGYSPFIIKGAEEFYLFYQTGWNRESKIVCRRSRDLAVWSEEKVILTGEKPWEKGIKGEPYVRNPCIVKVDRRYLLYYSAGYVLLPDTGYEEPSYISVAFSESLLGPYQKHLEPIISPHLSDRWRNLGAGAMKVYKLGEIFVGFNNGIYWGEDLHSHSAIHILLSRDGLNWWDSPKNPVLVPFNLGWKKSHVYQLDVKLMDDKLWMFYNARDNWVSGIERIGLAFCKLPSRYLNKVWSP